MKEELKEIQNELGVLTRTEQIVKAKRDQYEANLKQLEA